MNAKEYLSQLSILDTKINHKIQELNFLREKMTCIGNIEYDKDKVQISGDKEKMSNGVIRYLDLSNEVNQEIDKLCDGRHTIINQIHGLNNFMFINILYETYIKFNPLKIVAYDLGLSYEYTRLNHGRALREFENKYKNLQNIG